MTKTARRFLSMLLALSMVFGMLVFPVSATENEESAAPVETAEDAAPAAETTEEAEPASQEEAEVPVVTVTHSSFPYTLNTENIDVSDVGIGSVAVPEDAEIDENDREIIVISGELENITVLNDDGESVALTEEQIQTILYLYSQYQQVMKDNANIYGVQTPFFLAFNDDKEDGLGILGEMLVLAGTSVDDVRSGAYKYDDLVGMIQNFIYTYSLGATYYSEAILKAQKEALQAVADAEKASGGSLTEVQKLLVLNSWLAQNNTFDMPYIMNADSDKSGTIEDDEKLMEAPNGPQKPEHYDDVYEIVHKDYTDQFTQMFHDQIYDGIIADLRQQFYENAIKNIVYQNAYDQGVAKAAEDPDVIKAAVDAYWKEQYDAAKEAEETRIHDEAYNAYLEDHCEHEFVATFEWTEKEEGGYDATADVTCSECGLAYKDIEATVEKLDTSVEPTCTKSGVYNYKATATIATAEGKVLGTATDTKDVTLPALGHDYGEDGLAESCTRCGEPKPTEGGGEKEETEELPESTSGSAEVQILNDDDEKTLEEQAEEAAQQAVADAAENTDKVAKAAADEAVNKLSDDEKLNLAKDIVESDEDAVAQIKDAANSAAEDFMTENADAIKEDAPGFVKATFGEEVAAQLAAACDDFIADAKENGVALDQSKPEEKTSLEDLTQNTMETQPILDLDEDGENETTANQAISIFAKQAAEGMTTGVINGWKGCHIGAFGFGTSVCLGYAKAFTYLVQCMHPEVYSKSKSEDADLTDSENWISADELYEYDDKGNLNLDSGYLVDTVRVTFDTEVTMFGPDNSSNFGEVHFWNAVKVDGQWYYIDPCYVDVYVEVMSRDRVETDGNMNHLYFMFSHTSAVDMYDGYTNTTVGDDNSGITSLYANKATDKSYEDSWISRINCVPYFANGYAYYVYDSTDLLTILEDSEDNPSEVDYDASYKLVRHDLSKKDADDGDKDYFTLIAFNGENSDGELEARVYDPKTEETVRNELLTELVNRHTTYAGVYPSVEITSVLYGGKLYFNLANCILSIDLETYEVALVKEYNTVYGVRDDDVDFGGRAFSITTEDNADFTVENHPIAALSLKDGELTVSIATNFALISGKKVRTNPAIEVNGEPNGYGYEYEESNFNPNYNTYFNSDEGEQYGYEKEINDNDEFMWSANFVEKLNMSHLAGDSHTYEAVTVAAFCDMDGFTENRCTTCGAIEADSRVTDEGTAHEHHFVQFDEVYYTKDDSGSWNRGTSYVCAMCSYAVDKPTEPGRFADDEEQQEYEDKLAEYEAAAESAGHTYIPDEEDENTVWADDNTSVTFQKLKCSNVCPTRQPYLDALLGDDSISVELEESVIAQAEVVDHEGDCATGAIAVYAASGEAEGYAYTATKKVQQEAGKHSYTGTFYWTEVKDEDGNPTGEYTATADVTCGVCDDHHEGLEAVVTLDEEQSTEPSCSVDGKKVYVATVTVKDDAGKEIGSASESKEVPVEKLGHQFNEDGICEVCGAGNIRRIEGDTRYDTSIAIADELKDVLGVETFDTILVANGDNFPDALAGSYLAAQKDAPILLTTVKTSAISRDEQVLSYIEANLSEDGLVYILGESDVVSQAFEDGLAEINIQSKRLAGNTRFDTCLEVLKEAGLNGKEILVCSGMGYADALSASALGKPVLLVNAPGNEKTDKLTDAQKEYLKDGGYTFYIIGDEGVVSAKIESELKNYGTVEKRVYGETRHETSAEVAKAFFQNPENVTLTYSMGFADGLCGGVLASKLNAPLLLVHPNNTAAATEYVQTNGVKSGIVFGGADVVPDETARTVFGVDESVEIK